MMIKGMPRTPLHQRIYNALSMRIDSGEWGNGALLPTENEFCRQYQVSRGTVRLVLAELEQEGLVRRERGRGTFLTRAGAEKTTSTTNHHTISFIVPYVRDSFVSAILLGVESAARLSGYAVIFNHVENDLEKQDLALRRAIQQGVEGIILYPVNSTESNEFLGELVQKNFPLVLVDRYIRGLFADYVTSDNFGGGLIAAQHLLSLGHKRIAFLSWIEMVTTMEQRRAGYRQALQEAGIPINPDLEWEVKGYPEIDQETIENMLSQPERPTAVFAANDQLAFAVQRAARSLRMAIPDDLALVGFDNLDISNHVDIPLTTINQPAFDIGRTAGELLLSKIRKEVISIQKRSLSVQLIIRDSCGAIKHHSE